MTPQEIEDKIIAHLKTQKTRAQRENSSTCAYRSPDGLKCAVGCLIPDEQYNAAAEGEGVYFTRIENGKWTSAGRYANEMLALMLNNAGIPGTEEVKNLLVAWQDRHDDAGYWDSEGYIGPLDSVLAA